MSTAKPIRRVTLFKIPTEEGQEQLLAKYRDMPQKALKVFPPNSLSHLHRIQELTGPSGRRTIHPRHPSRQDVPRPAGSGLHSGRFNGLQEQGGYVVLRQ